MTKKEIPHIHILTEKIVEYVEEYARAYGLPLATVLGCIEVAKSEVLDIYKND